MIDIKNVTFSIKKLLGYFEIEEKNNTIIEIKTYPISYKVSIELVKNFLHLVVTNVSPCIWI